MSERTIKYIGNGSYIVGVPARDLTPEEYEAGKKLIEACPTKLYEVPEVKASKKAAPKAEQETGDQ